MSKKIQGLVFLLIVAGIALFAINKQKPKKPEPEKTTEVKTQNLTEPKLTYVDPEKLPEKFPADFPIEQGAEILQNYNNETDTEIQATRRFLSAKTLKQNFDFYNKYLKENGWEILASLNKDTVKSISAKKGQINIVATFSLNSNKESLVDISFTIKK